MKHFQDDKNDRYDSLEEYESGIGKHMANTTREQCPWLDED